MALEARSPAILCFGVFEVDVRSGELRKQGARIKLQEQPFHVLTVLLQRPGEVITREELRNQTWSADTFVDFGNSLNTAINKLREALGDFADNPRFIETLPRRGYRFIAPVTDVDGTTRGTAGVRAPAPPRSRRMVMALAVLGLAAFIVISFVFSVDDIRNRVFVRGVPPIHSIAVLPLENLSGDPSVLYHKCLY
jgi:DNA-binding winged helix-turn-helix (wHTH) protein